jgi:hypothetical protein
MGFHVGCPPEKIQQVVRDSYDNFVKCYGEGLGRNPKLEGRVSVRFVIDLDGRVQSSTLEASTLPDDEVARCVVNHMLPLRFPEPDGGVLIFLMVTHYAQGRQSLRRRIAASFN